MMRNIFQQLYDLFKDLRNEKSYFFLIGLLIALSI